MSYIAIASIHDSSELIGIRLLEKETGKVRDVPLTNIQDLIISDRIHVENLDVKNEVVVGYNGSIDRLPKVLNYNLVGKSALTILWQIDEVGYMVADFAGNIANVKTSDVIKYANLNGISNGKVVKKDGKEFISAIEGTYGVKKLQDICCDKAIKYTGEVVIGKKPLSPIVSSDIDSARNFKRTKMLKIDSDRDYVSVVDIQPLKKVSFSEKVIGNLYEYNGVTIYNAITEKVSLSESNKIAKFIRMSKFRDKVNNLYRYYDKEEYKRDKKLGRVKNVSIEYNIGEEYTYDNLEPTEIREYLNKLRTLKCDIFIKYNLGRTGNVALYRNCQDNGISYNTLVPNKHSMFNREYADLEDIYYYNSKYENVTVDGSIMTIIGLDGVYKYDMDIIHKTYNRAIVESEKVVKAKLIGKEYIEDVNSLGVLKKLKSTMSKLVIPDRAVYLETGSVVISANNTELIFGNHIKDCNNNILSIDTENTKGQFKLNYIEVGDSEARDKIIYSINVMRYNLDGCSLHLKFDPTPDEYIKHIRMLTGFNSITVENKDLIDDKYITTIMGKLVATELNMCNILRSKIGIEKETATSKPLQYYYKVSDKLYKFKYQYESVFSHWEDRLRHLASDELKHKIDVLLEDIKTRIESREIEANNEVKRLTEKEEVRRNKIKAKVKDNYWRW